MKRIYYIPLLLLFFAIANAQQREKKSVKPETIICDFHDLGFKERIINHQDPNQIYYLTEVHVEPEFPGSATAFIDKITPVTTKSDNCNQVSKERIIIYFVVEKDGTLTSFNLIRDSECKLGEKVLETAKQVNQKWKPGLWNEKPVRTGYAVAVTINTP
ncbi:hypothetical protein GWA97_12210 [Flavobacterium sp. LaA7.5]|nr:hypothetical protein [Flavobacterium salilacus subsp. altitudinum]